MTNSDHNSSRRQNYRFMMDGPPGPLTVINGKEMLYFGGVGYFQLHNHPDVIEAACEATRKYGLSSATSRAYTGMTPLHEAVEAKAAEFFGTEDAVYLPSGYLCNIVGMQALRDMGRIDAIYIDELAHYCNNDGAIATGLPVHRFANNDPESLRQQIAKTLGPKQKPLIATDGMFSVHGYLSNIPKFLEVAEEFDGSIWIDDAHPSGIIGPNGRGTYDYYGLESPRLFFGSTLSKAFGGFGGIVPGTAEFTGYVRKTGAMTGSTQPPAPAAAASLAGLELVMANPQFRQQLHENARYLKTRLREIGIDVPQSEFPMTAFSLATPEKMKQVHEYLLEKGIFIQLSHYVGAGKGGVLRIVVFSTHTKEQIDLLIQSLSEAH